MTEQDRVTETLDPGTTDPGITDPEAIDLAAAAAPPPEVEESQERHGDGEPTITLAEAARLYGISESTLRRRLADGVLPGARKRRGRKGEEWHLPVAALEQLGYRRHTTAASRSPRGARAAAAGPPPADRGLDLPAALEALGRLAEALEETQQELREARQARAAVEHERQEAVVAAARAEALLEAERQTASHASQRFAALEERVERLTEERDRYAQALGWSGRRRLRREARVEQLQQDERARFRRAFIGDQEGPRPT